MPPLQQRQPIVGHFVQELPFSFYVPIDGGGLWEPSGVEKVDFPRVKLSRNHPRSGPDYCRRFLMHHLLTTTALALLLGLLPALAAEDSSKTPDKSQSGNVTPDQSQTGNVTQSGATPGAGGAATQPEQSGAVSGGGAPPSGGVSSSTESRDISGDAEKRAKEQSDKPY
jgi:hypothetical protein